MADDRLSHQFLLFRPGELSRALSSVNAPVHVLGDLRLRQPMRLWKARRAFAAVLRQQQIEAVIYHQYSWLPLAFADLARGLKQIRWFHNAPPSNWTERLLLRIHPRFPDISVFCSDYLERQVPVQGRTAVVRAPVDSSGGRLDPYQRSVVRDALSTAHDSIVIAHVGRITPIKGQSILLEALGSHKDVARWTCWIIGGPQGEEQIEYFDSLRGLAAELGIGDRVRFTGIRSDVPRLLRAADIYCQPNLAPEAFGLTFIEALYAGLPVVTTGFGGAVEIVSAECGVLVPEASTGGVADALAMLMHNDLVRREMGLAAPQQARNLCDAVMQTKRLGDVLVE